MVEGGFLHFVLSTSKLCKRLFCEYVCFLKGIFSELVHINGVELTKAIATFAPHLLEDVIEKISMFLRVDVDSRMPSIAGPVTQLRYFNFRFCVVSILLKDVLLLCFVVFMEDLQQTRCGRDIIHGIMEGQITVNAVIACKCGQLVVFRRIF